MGNSEVGHLNLGAGAIVPQDLRRIDLAVQDGSLGEIPALREALAGAQRVHLIGLVSDGGVHASLEHLFALVELAAEWGIEDLVIHAFTDGRDTAPKGGAEYPRAPRGVVRAARHGAVSAPWSAATSRWTATALGSRPARLRPARPRDRRARRAHRRRGRPGRLRARRDGRVHRADRHRPGRVDPPRRRGPGLQLPPRPDARDHPRAGRPDLHRGRSSGCRGRRALHHVHPVRGRLDLPRRLPAAPPRDHPGQGPGGPRAGPAACRRDGEVPARDVLLQRRRRGRLPQGGACALAVAARRGDLRP